MAKRNNCNRQIICFEGYEEPLPNYKSKNTLINVSWRQLIITIEYKFQK